MIAKTEERELARKLRHEGESVRRIAKRLGVAYSSVSQWCRDIVLTDEQNEVLRMRAESPRRENLRKAVKNMRAVYEKRRQFYRDQGMSRVKKFSDRDFLMLGLGLYIGDGSKDGLCSFANANVAIQRFMLSWFEMHFDVTRDRFRGHVILHEAYRSEIDTVLAEWSHELGMPIEAFTKPSFVATRIEPKFTERGAYKGTLHLTVSKSGAIRHEILGMADALVYKGSATKPG